MGNLVSCLQPRDDYSPRGPPPPRFGVYQLESQPRPRPPPPVGHPAGLTRPISQHEHFAPARAGSTLTPATSNTNTSTRTNHEEAPAVDQPPPQPFSARVSPLESFNWSRQELIGQGAFGSVYAGVNLDTGEKIAIKQVALARDEGLRGRQAEHIRALECEVSVLSGLKHTNIVQYLGTQRTPDTLNIFLEFVSGGSLAGVITKKGGLDERTIRLYTKQLLKGLEYLHGQKIMHRDIKGANILVDEHGILKLADFGASKKISNLATLGSNYKSIKGTPYWMAPEMIKQTGHGRPADIWSLACVVIEMATGKPPWCEFNNPVAAMFHIASAPMPPAFPEHLSNEAKDFLRLCFNRNAKERPTASRLMKHPWLANVQLPYDTPTTSAPPMLPAMGMAFSPPSPVKEEIALQVSVRGSRLPTGDDSQANTPQSQPSPAPGREFQPPVLRPPHLPRLGSGAIHQGPPVLVSQPQFDRLKQAGNPGQSSPLKSMTSAASVTAFAPPAPARPAPAKPALQVPAGPVYASQQVPPLRDVQLEPALSPIVDPASVMLFNRSVNPAGRGMPHASVAASMIDFNPMVEPSVDFGYNMPFNVPTLLAALPEEPHTEERDTTQASDMSPRKVTTPTRTSAQSPRSEMRTQPALDTISKDKRALLELMKEMEMERQEMKQEQLRQSAMAASVSASIVGPVLAQAPSSTPTIPEHEELRETDEGWAAYDDNIDRIEMLNPMSLVDNLDAPLTIEAAALDLVVGRLSGTQLEGDGVDSNSDEKDVEYAAGVAQQVLCEVRTAAEAASNALAQLQGLSNTDLKAAHALVSKAELAARQATDNMERMNLAADFTFSTVRDMNDSERVRQWQRDIVACMKEGQQLVQQAKNDAAAARSAAEKLAGVRVTESTKRLADLLSH